MAVLPKTPAPNAKGVAVGFWNSNQLIGAGAITVTAGTETRSTLLDGAGFSYLEIHASINIPAAGTANMRVIYVDPETGVDVDPLSPPGPFALVFYTQAGAYNQQTVSFFADLQVWQFRIGFRATGANVDFTNPRLFVSTGAV
jgi:hypothetical protein